MISNGDTLQGLIAEGPDEKLSTYAVGINPNAQINSAKTADRAGDLPSNSLAAHFAKFAKTTIKNSQSQPGIRFQPPLRSKPASKTAKIQPSTRGKPEMKIQLPPPFDLRSEGFASPLTSSKARVADRGNFEYLHGLLSKLNGLEQSNRPSDEVLLEMKLELASVLSRMRLEEEKPAIAIQKPVPRFDQVTGLSISEMSSKADERSMVEEEAAQETTSRTSRLPKGAWRS